MSEKMRQIAEASWFQNFIIGVIVLAGLVVGIETYPDLHERFHGPLELLDKLIIGIFIVEIGVKMAAHGSRPWLYFKDAWNIFDFTIVAVCFLPLDAQYFAVLRLARLLRVLRLVRALPKLQVLVGALLKSLPSMGYISILLFLLFYLYAVLGTFMFQGNDPLHFGNLQRTFLTLYQTATFEGWIDRMDMNFYGCAQFGCDDGATSSAHGWAAAFYFVTFTVLATMVILNLFIGVIVGGMEEAQEELAAEQAKGRLEAEMATLPLAARLAKLSEQIEQVHKELQELSEYERRSP
jgi:voltage-gated sodium channel